jgi:hypothetical protein
MDTLAPILAMLFFSGALGKKGEPTIGTTPLSPGGGISQMGNPGASFMPNNAWLGQNTPGLSPEMIIQMLSGSNLSGLFGGL